MVHEETRAAPVVEAIKRAEDEAKRLKHEKLMKHARKSGSSSAPLGQDNAARDMNRAKTVSPAPPAQRHHHNPRLPATTEHHRSSSSSSSHASGRVPPEYTYCNPPMDHMRIAYHQQKQLQYPIGLEYNGRHPPSQLHPSQAAQMSASGGVAGGTTMSNSFTSDSRRISGGTSSSDDALLIAICSPLSPAASVEQHALPSQEYSHEHGSHGAANGHRVTVEPGSSYRSAEGSGLETYDNYYRDEPRHGAPSVFPPIHAYRSRPLNYPTALISSTEQISAPATSDDDDHQLNSGRNRVSNSRITASEPPGLQNFDRGHNFDISNIDKLEPYASTDRSDRDLPLSPFSPPPPANNPEPPTTPDDRPIRPQKVDPLVVWESISGSLPPVQNGRSRKDSNDSSNSSPFKRGERRYASLHSQPVPNNSRSAKVSTGFLNGKHDTPAINRAPKLRVNEPKSPASNILSKGAANEGKTTPRLKPRILPHNGQTPSPVIKNGDVKKVDLMDLGVHEADDLFSRISDRKALPDVLQHNNNNTRKQSRKYDAYNDSTDDSSSASERRKDNLPCSTSMSENPWGDYFGGLNPLVQPIKTRPRRNSRATAASTTNSSKTLNTSSSDTINLSESQSTTKPSPSTKPKHGPIPTTTLTPAPTTPSKENKWEYYQFKRVGSMRNLPFKSYNPSQTVDGESGTVSPVRRLRLPSIPTRPMVSPRASPSPTLDNFISKIPFHQSTEETKKEPTARQKEILSQLAMLRKDLQTKQEQLENVFVNE